jgi:hypothetical protein
VNYAGTHHLNLARSPFRNSVPGLNLLSLCRNGLALSQRIRRRSWPAPVGEAALACLPNVSALPSHQSLMIGPSLCPKDDGLFFAWISNSFLGCDIRRPRIDEGANRNSDCRSGHPNGPHLGLSPCAV